MSEKKLSRSVKQQSQLSARDWQFLESVSKAETDRFRGFLSGFEVREIEFKAEVVSVCVIGQGDPAVLMFTGGWGGPELAYETILALKDHHKMIIIDVGSIGQARELVNITDAILDQEKIQQVSIVGQSISGILGQLYFRQNPGRVEQMVLALTPAPQQKKARKWALLLIKLIPLFIFKMMMAKSLKSLSKTSKPIPEEVAGRLAFKGAFTARMFRSYITHKKLVGVLKLAFALSAAGDYSKEELGSWPGKLLVITSPDDPYHGHTKIFQDLFPRTEVVTLPEGYGHVAPQVYQKMFFSAIRNFLQR